MVVEYVIDVDEFHKNFSFWKLGSGIYRHVYFFGGFITYVTCFVAGRPTDFNRCTHKKDRVWVKKGH